MFRVDVQLKIIILITYLLFSFDNYICFLRS